MRSLAPLFRFLLRLQGLVVLGAEIDRERDRVVVRGRRHGNAKLRCPSCNRLMGGETRWTRHEWRHLALGPAACYVVADIREGRCPEHGRMVESVPWAWGRAKHTKSFDRQVASLVQVSNKSAAERMFDVSWRTVGRIVERVVDAYLPDDLLDDVTAIAVDETAYKRKHAYITVVTDLETGRVIWMGEGKSAETLGKFFEKLGPERAAEIELVCMDMSGAYRKAVEEHVPHADIVYDRFHIVKLLLEALDEVRREECRNTGGIAGHPLKNTRFSLLRNPKFLKPKDEEKIARVRHSNRRLTRAYELRVSFEDLWAIEDEEEARDFLMRWTRSALMSRLMPMRRFAKTIRDHLDGILGFFRYWRQTSGIAEGMNNKIQLAIHQAHGFRSLSALFAMVMLRCSGIDLFA